MELVPKILSTEILSDKVLRGRFLGGEVIVSEELLFGGDCPDAEVFDWSDSKNFILFKCAPYTDIVSIMAHCPKSEAN